LTLFEKRVEYALLMLRKQSKTAASTKM